MLLSPLLSFYSTNEYCGDAGVAPAEVLQAPLGVCLNGRIYECARECIIRHFFHAMLRFLLLLP